jgi:hypothetical protein
MSYKTRFSLSVVNDCDKVFLEFIEKHRLYAIWNYNRKAIWLNHEKDMRLLSRKFPSLLFKLEGMGESISDIWVKYFKDGRMQLCRAVISFEPFNDDELETGLNFNEKHCKTHS